jgi:hypothetical protein
VKGDSQSALRDGEMRGGAGDQLLQLKTKLVQEPLRVRIFQIEPLGGEPGEMMKEDTDRLIG